MLRAFQQLPIDKQQKILDSAASVFAEEGYHFASISSICKSAEISNGALYKYFKNKESLFFSVLDHISDLVEQEVYKKCVGSSVSIYEDVYNLLKRILQFSLEYHDYVAIYCDLGSCSMNRFAIETSEKFRKATSFYIIEMVEAGKKRNEISNNISNEIAAYMIDNYITLFSYSLVSEYNANRFNSFFSKNGESISDTEKIDIVIESLKKALKNRNENF